MNKALTAGLLNGKGVAFGLEILLRKNVGLLSGWLAYTYSRSLRKFAAVEEQRLPINNGDFYPSSFDQPHNLSVLGKYQLGEGTILSANFSFITGRPITIPVSKYSYDAYLSVLHYSERNEFRIPDYHRLDLSVTFEGSRRKNSTFKGDWVISLFNVYGRKNAYSIFFNRYGSARKVSILGSIFPSVNYNFEF